MTPTPTARVKAAGNLVGAALVALDKGMKREHPELFAEVSMQLHEALNELTKLMFQVMALEEGDPDGHEQT